MYYSKLILPVIGILLALAGLFGCSSGSSEVDLPEHQSPDGTSDPLSLPLLELSDLVYEGAFRVPAGDYGISNMNYAQGPIAYNAANHSLFMVGHAHQQAIAEFAIPRLVNSCEVTALSMADAPLQPFASVLNRTPDGNPQGLDRIGGMAVVDGQLLINAYEYYDAPGDNFLTTLVLRDTADLAGSDVAGFFTLENGAGHTSGWISPIAVEWQGVLGPSHITGQSSGEPIISRFSVGPSAFVFDATDITSGDSPVETPVPTTRLLDFSLTNRLHDDLANESGDNDLWTHLSRAVFGMIVPGTRTYLTVGYSGGHDSGVCYKCVQDDGNLCGGYCPPDPDDHYPYYWMWDLVEMVQVAEGTRDAHSLRPYTYGRFPAPIDGAEHNHIGGGTFDADAGVLYLTLQRADRDQGEYSNPPVIICYRFNVGA